MRHAHRHPRRAASAVGPCSVARCATDALSAPVDGFKVDKAALSAGGEIGDLANCSEFEKDNLVCPEDSEELLEQMQRPTRWRWLYQRTTLREDARPQRQAAVP